MTSALCDMKRSGVNGGEAVVWNKWENRIKWTTNHMQNACSILCAEKKLSFPVKLILDF